MAGQTVLIVEDQEEMRVSLSTALEQKNITVVAVGTAAEALTALQTKPVGVLVLDLLLPDESGIDILGKAKQDPKIDLSKIQLIILTTWDDPSILEGVVDTGTYDFLRKDELSLDQIVEHVVSKLSPAGT